MNVYIYAFSRNFKMIYYEQKKRETTENIPSIKISLLNMS